MKTAHYLGKLKGKKVYRFPVKAVLNDSRDHTTWGREKEEWHEVIASSAAAAANYVRDLYGSRPETEIFAYGPKGGETHRYVGWDSVIFTLMADQQVKHHQLQLL